MYVNINHENDDEKVPIIKIQIVMSDSVIMLMFFNQ